MNDKTKERINKLSILVGLLKSVGIGLPDYVIELTNDLIKIVEEKPEPRSVNSVRPCPFCEGPAQLFSDINSEGKAEYCYGCQCGEGPCDWYETKEEALDQWNEWASIDENGDEQ